MVVKKRKTRSDKGEIRATKRDLYCIQWIADQYAARGDQIQQLLTRYPDPQHPFQGKYASESTTREQISRWVRAGWVVYRRVLATGPGWAYVTRVGLHLVGLHEDYTARPPSPYRLEHIYAVNQVRLWMDEELHYLWRSERRYRAMLTLEKGESSGPIPDALIRVDDVWVAVEVQLSELKLKEWERKLNELVRYTILSKDTLYYEVAFAEIWVYVSIEAMKKAGDDARLKLRPEDQDRIELIVEDDLRMDDGLSGWA